jgi:hypothetical protein
MTKYQPTKTALRLAALPGLALVLATLPAPRTLAAVTTYDVASGTHTPSEYSGNVTITIASTGMTIYNIADDVSVIRSPRFFPPPPAFFRSPPQPASLSAPPPRQWTARGGLFLKISPSRHRAGDYCHFDQCEPVSCQCHIPKQPIFEHLDGGRQRVIQRIRPRHPE